MRYPNGVSVLSGAHDDLLRRGQEPADQREVVSGQPQDAAAKHVREVVERDPRRRWLRLAIRHLGGEVLEAGVRRQHRGAPNVVGAALRLPPGLFEGQPAGVVRVHGPDHHRDPCLGADLRDPPRLLDARGERLLAQDCPLARPACRDHLLGVELGRAGHHDDIHRRVAEHVIHRGRGVSADASGNHRGGDLVRIHHHPHGEEVGEPCQRREVDRLGHGAAAQNSHARGGAGHEAETSSAALDGSSDSPTRGRSARCPWAQQPNVANDADMQRPCVGAQRAPESRRFIAARWSSSSSQTSVSWFLASNRRVRVWGPTVPRCTMHCTPLADPSREPHPWQRPRPW